MFCHAKWGGRLAISLNSVWRLGWFDWSFLSALITPAWRVVMALSFDECILGTWGDGGGWWLRRNLWRTMVDENGDKSNGVSARLLWEAYGFRRCFWGETGDEEREIFFWSFLGRIDLEVKEKRVVDRRDGGSFGRRIENEGILDEH